MVEKVNYIFNVPNFKKRDFTSKNTTGRSFCRWAVTSGRNSANVTLFSTFSENRTIDFTRKSAR